MSDPTIKLKTFLAVVILFIHHCVTAAPEFVEEALERGFWEPHRQVSEGITSISESFGAGACVFDYNNDQWMDVLLIGGSGATRYFGKKAWWSKGASTRLYKNVGHGKFQDVTDEVGMEGNHWGMSCATTDLDSDGFDEVILSGVVENILYDNINGHHFQEVTTFRRAFSSPWSTGISISDVNGDGLLDIYISNFISFKKESKVFEESVGFKGDVNANFRADLHDSLPNFLLINKGNLEFFESASTYALTNEDGRSTGSYWLNFSPSTQLSLYVSNYVGSPSAVYSWDRNTFKSILSGSKLLNPRGVTGANVIASREQGADDIVLATTMGFPNLYFENLTTEYGEERVVLEEISENIGWAKDSALPMSTWGISSADFSNDGFVDFHMANGSMLPHPHSRYTTSGQPNILYINKGKRIYEPQVLGSIPYSSRSSITGDFNNDGKVDLLVTNNNELPQLFINTTHTRNNWVGFSFENRHGALNEYGISVSINFDGERLIKNNLGSVGFLSQSDRRIHFGLGASRVGNLSERTIREVTIRWPDGTKDVFNNVPINTYIHLTPKTPVKRVALPKRANTEKQNLPINLKYADLLDSYVYALLLTDSTPAVEKIFLDKYLSTDAVGQAEMLDFLLDDGMRRIEVGHAVLKNALQNMDSAILLKGIELAKKYELESSIYWLLSILNGPRDDIKCSVLKLISHFYDKEEALVHRKYLIVPELILMLESASDQTAKCIVEALGKSEQYRAVAVLAPLAHSKDESLSIEAIRALANIKDLSAAPKLISILKSKKISDRVYANILIALNELDYLTESELDIFLREHHRAGGSRLIFQLLLSSRDRGVDAGIFTIEKQKVLLDKYYPINLHGEYSERDVEMMSKLSVLLDEASRAALKGWLLRMNKPEYIFPVLETGTLRDYLDLLPLIRQALQSQDREIASSALEQTVRFNYKFPLDRFISIYSTSNLGVEMLEILETSELDDFMKGRFNSSQSDLASSDKVKIIAQELEACAALPISIQYKISIPSIPDNKHSLRLAADCVARQGVHLYSAKNIRKLVNLVSRSAPSSLPTLFRNSNPEVFRSVMALIDDGKIPRDILTSVFSEMYKATSEKESFIEKFVQSDHKEVRMATYDFIQENAISESVPNLIMSLESRRMAKSERKMIARVILELAPIDLIHLLRPTQ